MATGIPASVLAPERLAAVAATGLAGTEGEVAFDQLAQLAATILDAPLAFFTLVDHQYAWYKAAVGLPTDAVRCGPVEGSFCKYVIESRSAMVVNDARHDDRTRGNPAIEDMGVVAWAGFPVIDRNGQVLGSFCVVDTVPRDWSESQITALGVLASAAADQIRLRDALAAEHQARLEVQALRQRERGVVELFHRSLLPARLAPVTGAGTAVRYEASNTATDIGGDWYDQIVLGGGAVGLVVGDVCGHDVAAVAIMAQLRHTLHVLALNEPDPWKAVDLLDSTLTPDDLDRFASLAYAVWHPGRHELEVVSAGHPSPLIVRADGRAELVTGGRRPLVGVGMAGAPGSATSVILGPGDCLVLYTDGLVERRGSTIVHDIEHLRVVAEDLGTTDPGRVCDRLLERLIPSAGWDDDVALLAFRPDA